MTIEQYNEATTLLSKIEMIELDSKSIENTRMAFHGLEIFNNPNVQILCKDFFEKMKLYTEMEKENYKRQIEKL